MTHENPQTRLTLEMPTAPHILERTFDTAGGEKPFTVVDVGTDMWVTTESVPGVKAGALLIRDARNDVRGKPPRVQIHQRGLHTAIRQANHVQSAVHREANQLALSVDMAIEACMAARTLHLVGFSEVASWQSFVGHLADSLGSSMRGELKIQAQDFLDFASDPYDSLDRLNGPSRMLVLNAAIRRLEARIDILEFLVGTTFSRRTFELFALYDRIWDIRTRALFELNSVRVMLGQGQRITAEWVEATAKRMQICAALMDTVFIAPYGTHAFRYTKQETREIAAALGEERFDDASRLADAGYRSLSMLGLHRELEDKLRTVSGYNRDGLVPQGREQGLFARALQTRATFLRENPEIDFGFENRIAQDLAGHIEGTVDAAITEGKWNGQGVYESLGAACQCFGRRKVA